MPILASKPQLVPMPRQDRNWGVVVVIALTYTACADQSRSDSAAALKASSSWLLPRCEVMPVSTQGWLEVSSDDKTLTIRLPAGHRRIPSGVDGTWVIPGGTFSLSYASIDQRSLDSIATDSGSADRGWCLDELDGATALVQYGYAPHAPTGPGYYLQAYRPMTPRRWLSLTGFARDTSRATALFAIARSVRLRSTTPIR